MNNKRNLAIYHFYAPVYDFVFGPVLGAARKRSIQLLALQPGEHLLIPGVGTGLDLPLLPLGSRVTATDLSQDMLAQACAKTNGRDLTLMVMDSQDLQFPARAFDAVLLNLILSVVPDGALAFQEAWRVLRPGGRMVIFDKFLPEGKAITPFNRTAGKMISALGTDPNRRLSDLIRGVGGLIMEANEPSLLHGRYSIVKLSKENIR